MKMSQLVSVVTLTYKRFDKLYTAIDSVLAQDYEKIEYIISDDGSLDFPEEEIRTYINAHKRSNIVNVSILMHNKNQGTVRNINDAYRAANGEIIIPVSADDSFLDSTIIARIVEVYRQRHCDVLVIGRAEYSEHGQFLRNIPSRREALALNKLKNNQDQYNRLITACYFDAYSGCTLSVTKHFIEEWGYFDEKYVLLEDEPFFAQYLWNHYLECAFDIIGLRYNVGGVSNGVQKHPLLLKDDELFRKTDRIKHINEISWYQRKKLLYSLNRVNAKTKKEKICNIFKNPVGFIGIKLYWLSVRLWRD